MFNFVREKTIKIIKVRIRKNPIFGSIEPNPKKHQKNAKIRVRYRRTNSIIIVIKNKKRG